MGVSYRIVNIARKEFIEPSTFGDNGNLPSYGVGYHATALALLITERGDPNSYGPPGGTWAGDIIQLVPDYLPPDTHGFQTGSPDDPTRNMFGYMNHEFIDISVSALSMLCSNIDGVLHELAGRLTVPEDGNIYKIDDIFISLGKAALDFENSRIEEVLTSKLGSQWKAWHAELVSFLDDV